MANDHNHLNLWYNSGYPDYTLRYTGHDVLHIEMQRNGLAEIHHKKGDIDLKKKDIEMATFRPKGIPLFKKNH